MKKMLILGAFLLAGYGLNAQGLYLDFNVGYGLGFPGTVLGQESHTDIINLEQNATTENIVGSIGQGLHLQLTPGYMFNEHIGVELGLNYFLGAKVTLNNATSNITVDALGINKADYSSNEQIAQSNQFRVIPSLIVSTGTSNTLSGYAKAGIVIPVAGKTTVTQNAVDAEVDGTGITRDIIKAEIESKGAFSLGFRGAIGLNYKLSDRLSIFGEVYGILLNIKSKSRTINSYTFNGVDALAAMTTYDKETSYVKELTNSSNNKGYNPNASDGQPKEDLFSKTSFSQTGIEIGVKFNF